MIISCQFIFTHWIYRRTSHAESSLCMTFDNFCCKWRVNKDSNTTQAEKSTKRSCKQRLSFTWRPSFRSHHCISCGSESPSRQVVTNIDTLYSKTQTTTHLHHLYTCLPPRKSVKGSFQLHKTTNHSFPPPTARHSPLQPCPALPSPALSVPKTFHSHSITTPTLSITFITSVIIRGAKLSLGIMNSLKIRG